MHITMIAAISVDGKLTAGNDTDVHHWTSAEDRAHLHKVTAQYPVHVMGANTYKIVAPPTTQGTLRIILTPSPEDFADQTVAGTLEFSRETPQELVARLAKEGQEKILLYGGGYVYGTFVQAALVDELFLTLEPWLFGEGTPLLGGQAVHTSLRLANVTQLNDRGSLLLHYFKN